MNNLINFINSHAGCSACRCTETTIFATSLVRLPNGEVIEETNEIAATLATVRAWLGY